MLLWKALRERGLRAERQYETRGGGEMDLALLCALGNLGILLGKGQEQQELRERGGWRYLAFPESQVASDLPGVVQTIEQAVQRLGGLVA